VPWFSSVERRFVDPGTRANLFIAMWIRNKRGLSPDGFPFLAMYSEDYFGLIARIGLAVLYGI